MVNYNWLIQGFFDITVTLHFGFSFAYDAPRIWKDLPDPVLSATSLSIQKTVENLSLCNSLPTLVFLLVVSVFLCGGNPCNVSDYYNI